MKVTVKPTREKPIIITKYGERVSARVWEGVTTGGLEVELYVVSISPIDQSDAGVARLANELPAYFGDSYDLTIMGPKP